MPPIEPEGHNHAEPPATVDADTRPASDQPGAEPAVVDLGTGAHGSGGAIWSLPHGGDLDANLVCLDPGQAIGAHVNNEVDVLVFVQSGTGEVTVDDTTHRLGPDHLALIPRGARRSITAGPAGITYLSVHRRRGPFGVTEGPDKDTTS